MLVRIHASEYSETLNVGEPPEVETLDWTVLAVNGLNSLIVMTFFYPRH
jgi:hypothetical protein